MEIVSMTIRDSQLELTTGDGRAILTITSEGKRLTISGFGQVEEMLNAMGAFLKAVRRGPPP
jgi:hypothetical protein